MLVSNWNCRYLAFGPRIASASRRPSGAARKPPFREAILRGGDATDDPTEYRSIFGFGKNALVGEIGIQLRSPAVINLRRKGPDFPAVAQGGFRGSRRQMSAP